jgi:hypothetical protein
MNCVLAAEENGQKEEAIVAAEERVVGIRQKREHGRVEAAGFLVVEKVQLVLMNVASAALSFVL